jgi:hypothetical protein
MRRILSSICFTVALLVPVDRVRAKSADELRHNRAKHLGAGSAQHLLLLVSVHAAGVNPASFNSPESYLEAVRYRPIDNTFSFITSAASNDALL